MSQFTWQIRNVGTDDSLNFIAGNGAGVWVVVQWDRKVFRSTDNGATWTSLGVQVPNVEPPRWAMYTGSAFIAIMGAAFYSSPDGLDWTQRSSPSGGMYVDSNVWSHASDGVYGYFQGAGKTFRIGDGTDALEITNLPGAGYADFVAASSSEVLMTSSGHGEIYRSTDSGQNWSLVTSFPVSLPYSSGIYYLHETGKFALVNGDLGISYSSDGGATWSLPSAYGLPTDGGYLEISSMVGTPDGMLAHISRADDTSDKGLWFSTDGETWVPERTGETFEIEGLQRIGSHVVFKVWDAYGSGEYEFASASTLAEDEQTIDGGTVQFSSENTGASLTYGDIQDGPAVFSTEVSGEVFFLLEDTFVMSSEMNDEGFVLVEDTFFMSDENELSDTYQEIADGFIQLSSELNGFGLHPIRDEFLVSDARVESRAQFLIDTARLSGQVISAGAQSVESLIDISVEQRASGTQLIEDALSLSVMSERTSVSRSEQQDTIRLSDAISAGGQSLIEDVIEVADQVRSAASHSVDDQIAFSDDHTQGAVRAGDTLEDGFSLSDATDLQVVRFDAVSDALTFSDEAFYKNPGAIAWLMNTETAAAYWYSNWQFSDMVQVGDVVLAVGPEGLCVIGGNTDAGEVIDAVLKYGFMDFGTEQKKRLPEIVFGYAADTPMAVEVETYGQGYPAFEYRISPQRQSQQPTNGRLTPGKALNARYWRIAVHNTDGGAFSVNSITATVAESARRL